MKGPFFKKSVVLSLLGHLTVFSIFSVSFGTRPLKTDYSVINFRGGILSDGDLIPRLCGRLPQSPIKVSLMEPLSDKINKRHKFLSSGYIKPPAALSFEADKIIFPCKAAPLVREINKPVIMFYPRLPHYFALYFRNRQAAHIELMFNIADSAAASSIIIKRKISSGNLEADLLSIRYINNYLFIQQSRFPHNVWQTVKIDLSTRNDQY